MQSFVVYGVTFLIGCMLGGIIAYLSFLKKIKAGKKNAEKLKQHINMLNQWLILKEERVGLDYHIDNIKDKRVIIYGFGMNGRHLARALLKDEINVVAAIDRTTMPPYKNISVYKMDACNVAADVIINSVITEHQSISNSLRKYFNCPILCLEDIVFDSYLNER